METPTAISGIRGTTVNVDYCAAGGPGCLDLPPGVYVGVTDVSVSVVNARGRSIVVAG